MNALRAKKNCAPSMMRVRFAVRRICSGEKFGASMVLAGSANKKRTAEIVEKRTKILVMEAPAMCHASSLFFFKYSVNTGMKAADKAPKIKSWKMVSGSTNAA